jgi:hypothetical protein
MCCNSDDAMRQKLGSTSEGSAAQVGASVITADRPQGVTMKRLAALAAPKRGVPAWRRQFMPLQERHKREPP